MQMALPLNKGADLAGRSGEKPAIVPVEQEDQDNLGRGEQNAVQMSYVREMLRCKTTMPGNGPAKAGPFCPLRRYYLHSAADFMAAMASFLFL